jgi:hypothetical protein
VLDEGFAGNADQRQLALAGGCLDGAKLECVTDPEQLLADLDYVAAEIHVVPAEPENLTAAQAVDDQQHESRVQRIWPGSRQELLASAADHGRLRAGLAGGVASRATLQGHQALARRRLIDLVKTVYLLLLDRSYALMILRGRKDSGPLAPCTGHDTQSWQRP